MPSFFTKPRQKVLEILLSPQTEEFHGDCHARSPFCPTDVLLENLSSLSNPPTEAELREYQDVEAGELPAMYKRSILFAIASLPLSLDQVQRQEDEWRSPFIFLSLYLI
jgi:hypothetical protein